MYKLRGFILGSEVHKLKEEMTTVGLSSVCLTLPVEISSLGVGKRGGNPTVKLVGRRRAGGFMSIAVSSVQSTPVVSEKPEIELEFIGPKGDGGKCPVETARAISGQKLLRNIMLDNDIELYAAYGKVMNCGGFGTCGTCIVEILEGKELLNERTKTELRYLKKKPESWRLACRTIVGNKENSGKVVVQRLPQWKK